MPSGPNVIPQGPTSSPPDVPRSRRNAAGPGLEDLHHVGVVAGDVDVAVRPDLDVPGRGEPIGIRCHKVVDKAIRASPSMAEASPTEMPDSNSRASRHSRLDGRARVVRVRRGRDRVWEEKRFRIGRLLGVQGVGWFRVTTVRTADVRGVRPSLRKSGSGLASGVTFGL